MPMIVLAGVLPTRRLLSGSAEARLADLMIRRVVPCRRLRPCSMRVICFVIHKFYALPVVDAHRHMVGIIDVGVLTTSCSIFVSRSPTTHCSKRSASMWSSFARFLR
jgi:CBS-domain-containing membrane protein